MLPARLSVITLGAQDLPGLRNFYVALGWKELPGSDDNWAAFLLGGVVLALHPRQLLDVEAGGSGNGPGGGFTLACNVDQRSQVDAVFIAAVRAGATALAAPQDRSWGGRSGYVADPEGNRWEIAWAPGLTFGERGEVLGLDG